MFYRKQIIILFFYFLINSVYIYSWKEIDTILTNFGDSLLLIN